MGNKFTKSSKLKSSGVTLIELLVVMGVMGILAAVGYSILNPATQLNKTRDARRKGDLRQIQNALEMYRADWGGYPVTADFPACSNAFTRSSKNYMTITPCDPMPAMSGNYVYTSMGTAYQCPASSGVNCSSTYTLTACLQYTQDSERDANNGGTEVCTATYPSTVSYTVKNP